MGLIGNCSFIAQISEDTNVEWLCWPKFDSSFIFGSLLDKKKGGEFRILPIDERAHYNQSYLENTNILKSNVKTEDGEFEVVDFAPRFFEHERYYKPLMLVRKIKPLRGSPKIRIICDPKGDYGRIDPVMQIGSNHIRYSGLDSDVRLTSNIPIQYILNRSEFLLNETKYLVLTYGEPLESSLEKTSETLLARSKEYWQSWVKHCSIGEFRQSSVIRSALALKLHQYQDTGAIIAASTTSLPESPGSERNWDYRYCWIRDAFYTLNAFSNVGHFEEMEKYSYFLENIASRNKERIQPLFSITGEERIEEKIIELAGYLDNKPVRVGNQAYTHIQNDVYGQMLLSIAPLYLDYRFSHKKIPSSAIIVKELLEHIKNTMDQPDAGLWEFRNLSQKHCYTFLFHWAGCTAAEKIGRKIGDRKIWSIAAELKQQAAERIETCYDSTRGVYTQAEGVSNLDASLLQLISMGYLDRNSSKAAQHLKVLESELRTPEGLFYRYKHSDDFGVPKTTFLVCAFWYVDALTCVGRVRDAIEVFDTLTNFSNHLGLFSEDIDPVDGSQWGNFPQTYSHVGLMNSAFRISRKLDKPLFLS
ncbi:glycoside hydrolase family 15 protein [Leptospira sanjuanensis]|uniref:glycoside hydrolase family 15 protein n=1 Tax=Leptospira sanjuanensis TaxID=2879643 RepID=UPI001EE87DA0|nr:glycoside hydrolase family 15 protein [Leptospira sanjuanensis]MCG6169128.1 glycoside hydrolase family 15 protein [Leptospira sanjuanensis]